MEVAVRCLAASPAMLPRPADLSNPRQEHARPARAVRRLRPAHRGHTLRPARELDEGPGENLFSAGGELFCSAPGRLARLGSGPRGLRARSG